MKNITKNIIIPSLIILFIPLIIVTIRTLITNSETSFILSYYNVLCLFTTFMFIIGGFMFLTEQKIFNIYLYSIKNFRSTLSKNYRYNLIEQYSIDDEKDIKQYLKDNYLYKDFEFVLTKPIFYSSTLLFIILSIITLKFFV